MVTKDWSDNKRAVRASIRRRNRKVSEVKSRGKRVASSAGQKRVRARKKSDKMNGEDRDGAYEERNQVEEGRRRSERKRRQLTFDFKVFLEKCEALAITVDHIPLLLHLHYSYYSGSRTTAPLDARRTKLSDYVRPRVKNLSALKLIRQRTLARSRARSRMSLIEKKLGNRVRYRPRLFHFPRGKMRALRRNGFISPRKFDVNTRPLGYT